MRAAFSGIVGQGAHCHQPTELETLQVFHSIEQLEQLRGDYPALLRLIRAVYLHQHPLGCRRGHPTVELGRQIDPVDRVDQAEAAAGVARFVSLESADQVPLHRQIHHRVLFLERLLDPIFPDVAKPGRDRGPYRFGPMGLGDRDDLDWVGPSPDRLMPGRRLSDLGQVTGQVREVHSLGIYQDRRCSSSSADVKRRGALWRAGLGKGAEGVADLRIAGKPAGIVQGTLHLGRVASGRVGVGELD